MIAVEEAARIILSHVPAPREEEVHIIAALDRVLKENIIADRDFPPFNRVMMDGIAIDSHEWERGRREYIIEGIQTAGSPQATLTDKKNCLEVMTGAMLPLGTDTVIRYEDIIVKDSSALVNLNEIVPLQNVHLKGTDRKAGEVLIRREQLLSPAEIAVLATVGKSRVTVARHLSIAIVSTGDELVSIDDTPSPYQIRQSNVYALESALFGLHHQARVYHIKDEKDALTTQLEVILADNNVVILSGGVSKGKKDYVPEVLDDLGVEKLFHGVKQRPGKPFWFGKRSDDTAVFALPGNPVSTFMCFYRYVVPYLNATYHKRLLKQTARLAAPFTFAPELTYFLQVKITNMNGELLATPVVGQGSGDLANLLEADAFLELPPNKQEFRQGEAYPVYFYRNPAGF